jgi:hypothetical protein
VILYLEVPQKYTEQHLDSINSFSKVAGYKINLQQSLAFLYTKNEQIQNEFVEIIKFTIASKKIKIEE